MGRKITAIRVDLKPNSFSVRALSKSRRGSTFTLRGSAREHRPVERDAFGAALEAAIRSIIAGDPETT